MVFAKSNVISSAIGRPDEAVLKVDVVSGQSSSWREITIDSSGSTVRTIGGTFSDGSISKVVTTSSTLTLKDETKKSSVCIGSQDKITSFTPRFFGQSRAYLERGYMRPSNLSIGGLFGKNWSALDFLEFFSLRDLKTLSIAVDGTIAKADSVYLDLSELANAPVLESINVERQTFFIGDIGEVSNLTATNIVIKRSGVSGNIASVINQNLVKLDVSIEPNIRGNIEDFLTENLGRTGSILIVWGGSSSYPIRWHGVSSGGNVRSFTAVYDDNTISVSEGGSVIGAYDGTSWTYN